MIRPGVCRFDLDLAYVMLMLLCTRMASRCGVFTLFNGRFSSGYIRRLTEIVPRKLHLEPFDP